MWNRLRSIWTITDLRNKILFTLGMLLLYRLLASIPVPLASEQQFKLTQLFASGGNNGLGQLLGLLDAFSGGSLQLFSIAALGVYPYISATIVMQLLAQIVPALRELQTESEAGRRKFLQITRIVAVPLAFLQAFSQQALFVNVHVLDASDINLLSSNWLHVLTMLMTLTAGTMILVWFGELITEYGLGNGTSLIIFAGIVSSLPGWVGQFLAIITASGASGGMIVSVAVLLVVGLLTIFGMVYLYQGQRRVPVEYPTKRQVGRGMLVGSSKTTYIPIQVNSAGMVPLIFASSMLLFPSLIARYLSTSSISWLASGAQWVGTYLANPVLWYYWLVYFVLVVAFTYMYAYMQWEQQKIPETLQKQGAYVKGFRPGEPTRKHLLSILSRLTLIGALCLGIAAVLPFVVQVGGNQLLNSTKLLISVGVVLDTLRQFDAQMAMRNYAGFLS